MKKRIFVLFAAMLLVLCSACVNDSISTQIDDASLQFRVSFDDDSSLYGKYSPEVIDTLNEMLDAYVSGLLTPPQDSIPSTPVDPSDPVGQDIVKQADSTITSEQELLDCLHLALKNADAHTAFMTVGSWMNDDVLYDVIFRQIHDSYIIDSMGLWMYSYSFVDNQDGSRAYDITFNWVDDKSSSEILDMRQKTEARCKEIIRDLNLGNKNEYEKVFAINKYLCDTVYYPNKPYIAMDHVPYATVFTGRAVCEGYARTAKILADLSGLECYYVVGYCNNDPINGGHAWNLVKVDGQYYQLDVTWNDCSRSNDYFLVTDEFMTLSREWTRSDYPASAVTPYKTH